MTMLFRLPMLWVAKDGMAIAGKGVKGKEALHVVFLNFEQGLSF